MYHGAIDVPTFAYFEFGNIWSGSLLGEYNYRIEPKAKAEPPVLHVSIWFGITCSEVSDIAEEFDEELSEQGYEKVIERINESIDRFGREGR